MSARPYALLFAASLCLAPFAPAGDDKPDKPAADGPPHVIKAMYAWEKQSA